ncbi:MAG TPA: hypothetical protein VF638_06625 [Sphingomonas sp.]|jgi:hypothetical protein
MALFDAKARIEFCIDAALANEPVTGRFAPDFPAAGDGKSTDRRAKSAVSARALIRTSMFLRRHLAMDRHHEERSCRHEGTNAGKAMVDSARKQFHCFYPDDAIAVLVNGPAL